MTRAQKSFSRIEAVAKQLWASPGWQGSRTQAMMTANRILLGLEKPGQADLFEGDAPTVQGDAQADLFERN